MVAYDITPTHLNGHLFNVSLTIEQPMDKQELWLPNWIPGSYLIRDFSKHIIGLHAESNGRPLTVKQIAKNRWQLESSRHPVTVHYQVYAWDLSVRSAYLDQFQGFFNNTSLCLAVEDQTEVPCELHLHAPPQAPEWQVATGMPRKTGKSHSWGTFQADNYDALIDYPFLMGDLTVEEFIAHGIKHSLVLSGRHFADIARITADLARICETQLSLFEEAPFQSYTFLTMVVGDGFGGLEHRNSTALLCSRKDLISAHQYDMNDDYQNFLSLCCHEYFHSWNIKTLKPRTFIPYQLEQESYTEQLWFYEGMTSYFDDYLLHASGIISHERYLKLLGNTIARVERGTGQFQQSVTESSFLTWTKFYQQNENAANSIVSYYAKGALIALSLDLMLRLQSGHKLTLARVMKELWHEFGKTAVGTADDTVLSWLNHYPGIDVSDFLKDALYDKVSLPLVELLENFGVTVEKQVPGDDNSTGGKASEQPAKVNFGAKYKASPQGLELINVYHDESAYQAGLSAGDRIIAIDHLQITDQSVKSILERYLPGETVVVHAFRRDELMTLELTWLEPAKSNYLLSVEEPDKLKGWLTPSG
ncbi:M61 family metallopeptidase [Idiomarina aminovorans]|uniref:M61 family metallopeptidase n=1 Tax=Idiomarina aminovorans TaxID=2914829 RepID=UPI002003A45F|nr:PDZ domain-containing protein [Idiomarina sp. ATCH4]MCK7458620.1 PDZ domain-containing protein [Idiomarina sp. ATCH4]